MFKRYDVQLIALALAMATLFWALLHYVPPLPAEGSPAKYTCDCSRC